MPMGHNLSCWSVVTDGGLLSLLCGGRSGLYAIIGTQPAPTATYSGDGRGAGVAVLAPGFVDGDRGRVGEVERAQMRHHGDAQCLGDLRVLNDLAGETCGFGAEEEDIVGLVRDVRETVFRVAGEREDAFAGHFLEEGVTVRVDLQVGEIVVVQPSALEVGVGEVESEGLDEVKRSARAGGEADSGAGVAGDTRLVEDNMEHAHMLLVGARKGAREKRHVGVCDGVVAGMASDGCMLSMRLRCAGAGAGAGAGAVWVAGG